MSIAGNEAGIITGAALGLYKGFTLVIAEVSAQATVVGIDWMVVLQACIISFLGGILGWLGSEIMRQIKKKLIK